MEGEGKSKKSLQENSGKRLMIPDFKNNKINGLLESSYIENEKTHLNPKRQKRECNEFIPNQVNQAYLKMQNELIQSDKQLNNDICQERPDTMGFMDIWGKDFDKIANDFNKNKAYVKSVYSTESPKCERRTLKEFADNYNKREKLAIKIQAQVRGWRQRKRFKQDSKKAKQTFKDCYRNEIATEKKKEVKTEKTCLQHQVKSKRSKTIINLKSLALENSNEWCKDDIVDTPDDSNPFLCEGKIEKSFSPKIRKCNSVSEEIQTLISSSDLFQWQKENNEAKNKINEIESFYKKEIEKLTKENDELKKENARLSEIVEKKETETREIAGLILTKKSDKEGPEKENTILKNQIKEYQQEINKLTEIITQMNGTKAKQQESVWKESCLKLEATNKEKDTIIKKLKEKQTQIMKLVKQNNNQFNELVSLLNDNPQIRTILDQQGISFGSPKH